MFHIMSDVWYSTNSWTSSVCWLHNDVLVRMCTACTECWSHCDQNARWSKNHGRSIPWSCFCRSEFFTAQSLDLLVANFQSNLCLFKFSCFQVTLKFTVKQIHQTKHEHATTTTISIVIPHHEMVQVTWCSLNEAISMTGRYVSYKLTVGWEGNI